MTARLWAACCWPATMEDGWKMGDYCFVIFEVSPEPRTCVYIQFWSEPRKRVLMEFRRASGARLGESLFHGADLWLGKDTKSG